MSTLDSSSLNHGAEVPGTAVPAGLEEAALERQETPAVSEPADSAGLAGEAVQPAAECAMADAPDEQPAADPAASDNLQPSAGESPAEGAEPVAESTPSVAVLDNYVAPLFLRPRPLPILSPRFLPRSAREMCPGRRGTRGQ